MPYQDNRNHVWSNPAPAPGDPCSVCGVNYEQSTQYECEGPPAGSPAPTKLSTDDWDVVSSRLRGLFEDDLSLLEAKFNEYGDSDLSLMGRALVARRTFSDIDRVGQERAVGFYLLGKTGRLHSAWERGNEPSEDTWRDASLYALMGRYIRKFGSWT